MILTKKSPAKFHRDMNIGEVLPARSGAEKVIEEYFDNRCFTCSGINMESITFGAMMHNVDPEVIFKELNELE